MRFKWANHRRLTGLGGELAFPISQIATGDPKPGGGADEPCTKQPWTLIPRPQVTQVGRTDSGGNLLTPLAGESGEARNGAAQPGTLGALGYRG